jgi:hypothetical protein
MTVVYAYSLDFYVRRTLFFSMLSFVLTLSCGANPLVVLLLYRRK